MAKGKYVKWLEEENLIRLQGWAMDGLTDEDIAENIGINRATLYDWKKRFPDIDNALKKGKETADRRVENALFKRALGYEYEEKKYIMVKMDREEYDELLEMELEVWHEKNPNATRAERDLFIASVPRFKRVLDEVKTKHVTPDTTAQIFWLKNRKPQQWRDKQQIEHSGNMDHNVNSLTGLSVEELREIAKLNKE